MQAIAQTRNGYWSRPSCLRQAGPVDLLKDLQAETGVSYLFVSHDMAVVEYLAHDVAVIESGRIVEKGPGHSLMRPPIHAYTQRLLDAILLPEPVRPQT